MRCSTVKENKLKRSIKRGETVKGLSIHTSDPAIVEIAGYAGFDFVILDMEHTPHGLEVKENQVRAAEAAGITPLIKVAENNPITIRGVLEIGAQGIVLPHICTKEDAIKAIQAVKFRPEGKRGFSPCTRVSEYGKLARAAYIEQTNQATEIMVIPILEDAQAFDNLKEIIQVKGIDLVFLWTRRIVIIIRTHFKYPSNS